METVMIEDHDTPGQDHNNLNMMGVNEDMEQQQFVDSGNNNVVGRSSAIQKYKYLIGGTILVMCVTVGTILGVTLSGDKANKATNSLSGATDVASNTPVVGTAAGSGATLDNSNWSSGIDKEIDSNAVSNNNDANLEPWSSAGSAASSNTVQEPSMNNIPQPSTTTGNNDSTNGSSNSDNAPTASTNGSLIDLLQTKFNELDFPQRHFHSFNANQSPQSQALLWMTENDEELAMLDDARKLQRYALATFFYATYAVTHPYLTSQLPWRSADKWLSNFHECEWEGINCDPSVEDGNRITSIVLTDNRVSGSIPLDLGLLGEHLQTVVLSTNLLYMDGGDLDVFGHLKNLQDLKLDDNYIVARSGLPQSLQNLKELERVVLSYNLLQGKIPNNYFTNMAKLSHLEVESNYLSGGLPSSLLAADNLVYLYMRRNNLSFKLDEVLTTARWPKIFSLWMDNNNITGYMPTEIGLLTGLASLSMTNSSVTGVIPSEIGKLSGLRRLWLYNNNMEGPIPPEMGENLKILEVVELYENNFTGEMPSSLCTTIEKSTYRFKELSADCQDITCTGCCTKCY